MQVFVDPKSMLFLDGMTLDWKDSLMQSGFVFENPNAKKSCGCGTSFSALSGVQRACERLPMPSSVSTKFLRHACISETTSNSLA